MIQSLATLPCRLNENVHLVFDIGLTDVVRQGLRAHGLVDDFIVAPAGGGDYPIRLDAHTLSPTHA